MLRETASGVRGGPDIPCLRLTASASRPKQIAAVEGWYNLGLVVGLGGNGFLGLFRHRE
jgi:hypothetical protein